MKHSVGHTRNGIAVYVDLTRSDAAKRIAHQPHLLGLVEEVLKQISPRGPEASIEHDMGRTIGYSFIVSTGEKDTVFYAQLLRDNTYTRFVKNGKPFATPYLTTLLRRNESDKTYELYDIWIGRVCPPRPGTPDETEESKPYWSNHAVVWDNQSLQSRTITKVCPY